MIDALETKMKILAQPGEVYQAFVEPEELKNFWFTYSSALWQSHATVQLGYREYHVEPFDIHLEELKENQEIPFWWGEGPSRRRVTITIEPLDEATVLVGVREEGYREGQDQILEMIDSKGGWTFMLTCLKAYLEHGVTSLKLGMFL